MKTSVSTTRNHAYVVRSSDLEKLYKLLEDRIGTVTVSASCADDMKREFDNWEEVDSFDNPPSKKIISLSIRAINLNAEKHAFIDFRNDSFTNMSIDIKGQEDFCLDMKSRALDIIDQVKPWYSLLSYDNFSSYVIQWIMSYTCFRFVYYKLFGDINVGIHITTSVLAIITTLFVVIVVSRLRPFCFPSSYFAMGHGKERYKIAERVRWGVVVALAISIVSSIVASLAP